MSRQWASGDLTLATNIATKLNHIVKVRSTAFDDDVDGLSKHLTKKDRARKIAEIPERRRQQLSATALCGVRGETAAWGNGSRYYWTPISDPEMNTLCKGCRREWDKRGRPAVHGWDFTASPEDEWPWELPFAWRQVPAVGHPWDVPADQSIEDVKDDTGTVRGEHRVELRRWQRGPAIVRLVHHTDSDTYSARRWRSDAGPDGDRYSVQGTLKHARQQCHTLMARGGY